MSIQNFKDIAQASQAVRRKTQMDMILFNAYTRIWLFGAFSDFNPGPIEVAGGVQFRLPLTYQGHPGELVYQPPYDRATLQFTIGAETFDMVLQIENGRPMQPDARRFGEYFLTLDNAITPP